jgi:hypothetical protein
LLHAGDFELHFSLRKFCMTIRMAQVGVILFSIAVLGCGSGGKGPRIAAAGGTLTYKGAPVADATVLISPAKGPVAMAITDAQGKFTCFTGATRGAVVGDAKVSVRVPIPAGEGGSTVLDSQSKDAKSGADFMSKMAQSQYDRTKKGSEKGKVAKSLLPEKYSSPETSGLTVKVSADASKNNFELQLE